MKLSEDVSFRQREVFARAVQEQLNRVLASELFSQSPRHQLLLRTIVSESLAGHTEALKEIVLARDVFGRADYDPKRHTLVRVEVNAVRRKLAEYYSKFGSEDHVHIDIPRGHYVAMFSFVAAEPEAPRRWGRWYVVAACAAVLVSAMVLLLARRRPSAGAAGVPVQITFDTGWTAEPAISRDGSVLVYSSDRGPRGNADIWIQQAGKAPRQLTDDPGHDITPDISPDGKQIVFRSWRKEEGVWSMSADGENLKLLAKGGYTPRFSPDGKWVAFSGMAASAGHIFTVPANGGAAEQLDYGIDEASCPVWSPNGTQIVFVGQGANGGKYDLWIAKASEPRNELSRPLGVQAKLHEQNLPVISSFTDCPQDWLNDRLLFVTHQNATSFLFQAALESSGRLGEIRGVDSAIGANGVRVVRSHGKLSLLFAPERRLTNIWGYSLSGSGPIEQLTHDATLKPGTSGTWPALSGDGNLLAFVTKRAGPPDICLKDLRLGSEELLAASPSAQSPLFLDRNGGRIVFVRAEGSVMLRDVAEKKDRLLTTDCPILQDWSSNGELLLCADSSDLFELRIGQSGRKPLLHLTREPELARFSPDARWVSFVSTTGEGEPIAGYIAPLDGSNRTIQVDQEVYTLSLHWTRDGNAVYYWSMRDGFRCLYMQRLDPETKVPRGAALAILHRHGSQHYPWSGGTLAVGARRLAMTLTDELANIWEIGLPH